MIHCEHSLSKPQTPCLQITSPDASILCHSSVPCVNQPPQSVPLESFPVLLNRKSPGFPLGSYLLCPQKKSSSVALPGLPSLRSQEVNPTPQLSGFCGPVVQTLQFRRSQRTNTSVSLLSQTCSSFPSLLLEHREVKKVALLLLSVSLVLVRQLGKVHRHLPLLLSALSRRLQQLFSGPLLAARPGNSCSHLIALHALFLPLLVLSATLPF